MLKKFYSGPSNCTVITAEQGSLFAKDIAGDFNPLHDVDAKRFCVPGDLLFAIVLEKYGLSETMNFTFTGMLGRNITLNFPTTNASDFDLKGSNNKTILKLNRSGEQSTNKAIIDALVSEYVAFSGHNFPYVLVPLMQQQQSMINLNRPLVMYDSMRLEFDHLNFTQPTVEMLEPELKINGKRGDAHLHFQIKAAQKIVGRGFKRIVISSICAYNDRLMQGFIEQYLQSKEAHAKAVNSSLSSAS